VNNHQLASAVNRLVIAKGIVEAKHGQASYWRLRALVTEGSVATVEELWEIVQARVARYDAAQQAREDAHDAKDRERVARERAALGLCEQHQDCECAECVAAYHRYLAACRHEEDEDDLEVEKGAGSDGSHYSDGPSEGERDDRERAGARL